MSENDRLEQLKSLVSNYTANIDEYKNKNIKYDESNTRTDFIDKFFTLLIGTLQIIKHFQNFTVKLSEKIR